MTLKDSLKIFKYASDPVCFMNEIVGLDVEWFHKEWLELFENHKYISLLAPRSHGKTMCVGTYILWNILRDPTIRILIVTINQDKANEMMSFVQQNLLGNEDIISIWGEQKNPAEWSKQSIRVINTSGRKQRGKEPTLSVVGVTSSMVGGHYDLIILDDITDQKNSKTDYLRKGLENWYSSTLLPMLEPEPESKLISIGTKWHQNDIHEFFRKGGGFKCRTYKALRFVPNEEQLEKGMKPQVLWPNRWSYKKLMEIKNQAGTVNFSMQYQNEVVSAEDAIIKWEWLENSKRSFNINELQPPYTTYMGVDLASKGEHTDFFSLSIIAIKDSFIYLIDGFRGDLTMREQFNKILEYDIKHSPIKIGIDSAAQQKMITEQLMEDKPTLPIIPIKPSIVNDKDSRVSRLSVYLETNRLLMNPAFSIYFDELSMYPRGANDDTIDSLSFAMQAANLEEDSRINWDRMPNLIDSRVSKNVTKKGNKSYNVYKI